jgi:DNA end-binding protein Ku
MEMVAIGRVVLTSREHIIGLEPLGKGLMGTLIRYPYEVRDEKEYFDDIQDVKVTKDMLDLARHIVNQKATDFEPERFEDHYESVDTAQATQGCSRPKGDAIAHKWVASAPRQKPKKPTSQRQRGATSEHDRSDEQPGFTSIQTSRGSDTELV